MRVSVVIPSYDCGRFVAEAVESALNQTMPPNEVIVIDDGSTDNTAEVLRPYAESGRIHFVRQQNAGVSAARNRGLSEATGEFVAFLDADDYWHPKKLELQLPCFAEGAIGLVACGISTSALPESPNGSSVRRFSLTDIVLRSRFATSSVVVRKSVADAVGGFDPSLVPAEDRDCWLKCAAVAGVAYLTDELVYYRVHPTSLTFQSDRMIAAERRVLDKAFATLPALRNRRTLRRKAYAMASLSASYMLWRDSGRPKEALREFARSLRLWPFPFLPSESKSPFYRLRFGIRLALAGVQK